ncbi:MAG TPA: EboA domain-containing protein [Conexibacter sp.]
MIPLDPDALAATLDQQLDSDQRAWLAQARERVANNPQAVATLFPAVGRNVGRGPLDPRADREDVHAWTRDDAARVLLLTALGDNAEPELPLLYRHGDAAERRAVLRSLSYLDVQSDTTARPLVDDALRTNDTRLIAAALGPYSLDRLDDPALAQAVLKCVFVGVPLTGIAGLEQRVTPALTEMLARFVHERIAAGRTVPADVWPVIDRHPPTHELASIASELQHAVPERRQAAQAALDARATTQAQS